MEKGSLITLIDSLEKMDYVKRLDDPNDHRKKMLSLTAEVISQLRVIEADGINLAVSLYTDGKKLFPVSTGKSNLGHAMTASGMVSLCKILLSIGNKKHYCK